MGRNNPQLIDPVAIGRIVGAHGVRGTVKVKALGSGRHLRKGVEPLVDDERRRILTARETPKGFLVDICAKNPDNETAIVHCSSVSFIIPPYPLRYPQ